MARRHHAPRRLPTRDDIAPMDIELDELDGLDDDFDDVDFDALYGAPGRSNPRRGGAIRLPHDWMDFDYGGGVEVDWR